MQRYKVKGNDTMRTFVEVLEQSSRGYRVRVIRETRYETKESIELMSRELFETCLRTSYFIPEPVEGELLTGIA